MSDRQLGVLKGAFEKRSFAFCVSTAEGRAKKVFLHHSEWVDNEPMQNGRLVSYESAYDGKGREYAKSARFATVEETADRRVTGWIRSYDETRDSGCLHDAGGTFYRFRACDICCDALWPEQQVTFFSQTSPLGKRFALLIDADAIGVPADVLEPRVASAPLSQ